MGVSVGGCEGKKGDIIGVNLSRGIVENCIHSTNLQNYQQMQLPANPW